MKRTPFNEMAWLRFDWQRPFEPEKVMDMLTHLTSHIPQTPLVFEARGGEGRVNYYLGVDRQFKRMITDVMRAHGDIRFYEVSPDARTTVNEAAQLKITKPILSLKTDITEAVVRAGLAALMQPKGREQLVLQIVLGEAFAPRPTPYNLPDPHASWVNIALGDVREASAESKAAVKEKFSCASFQTVVRLGAAGSMDKAQGHILSLLSALRTLRSAGVNIHAVKEKPEDLNVAKIPWHFTLRLSVKELVNFMLLPAGDAELPGVTGLYPKQIMPPDWYHNPYPVNARTFAVSLDGKTKLSISPQDSKEHTLLIGPTGSGKSTAMLHLILSDIYAGRSVLVIDPKADLARDVLERIPKHRLDDVVIIDPSSPCPVGFNPLAFKNQYNQGLIADAVLAVFQEVFKENWGIRSQSVISAALLTLVQIEGASLLWLPTLLTNENFRKKITSGITDKIGLELFWETFEAMKGSEQRQEIAPALNKIQQFLFRPGLRNVLGQSDPKFDLMDLFTKPRIVLVPLNKGLIGSESAKLLGSLIVGLTWTLALSRANIPSERRRLVSIFIDELQDYLALPTDLSDALAQARGLGVGLTLAHQFRKQLPEKIQAGVDANARNKIVFGLDSADDAKAMAAMAPGLTYEDFKALPRYQVYASFNSEGRNTGWISGKTLPMGDPLNNAAVIRNKVAARYGKSGAEVEQEYLALLAERRAENEPEIGLGTVGRRKKA
ncbi:hypothetical protein FACS1894132_02260 [Clostridia bacterium]|nr:hypothetical protein FACS1894132_02260 [Clostridia bacterium]